MRALARRHGVSPTTVRTWPERETTADAPVGPKKARSTVPTPEEEAVVVAFRRRTPPPLDDRLHGLQPAIPHLARSALRRPRERHGIGRPPEAGGGKAAKKRFDAYPLVRVHIDIAEVRTEEGEPPVLVAVDRRPARPRPRVRRGRVERRLTKVDHPWAGGQSLPRT